jgi:hypothetical protein
VSRDSFVNSLAYMSTPATTGKSFGWQSPEEWEKARAVLIKHLNVPDSFTRDSFFTNDFVAR